MNAKNVPGLYVTQVYINRQVYDSMFHVKFMMTKAHIVFLINDAD